MRRMKIQLICGFLGAGKTTLLKSLIRQETADTVILINEFGELGIDGALISQSSNLNVIEMPSGCICCTLKESLSGAVREIIDRLKPKQLIIEPSGIAAPSSIILGLKNADFWREIKLAPVIGVIDLTFYPKVISEDLLGSFFQDQILNSDIILLNKADLVTTGTIEECSAAISANHPSAIIIPTIYCQAELPRITATEEVTHFHFSPQFCAEAFTFSGIADRGKMNALLKNLENKDFGDIFRAKGIIKTDTGPANFDYVNGLINFDQLKAADENKFVFIGRNIDRIKLENAIRGVFKAGAMI